MDEPAAPTLTLVDVDAGIDAGVDGVDARLEPWPRRLWRAYVTDVRATANARAVVSRATDRQAAVVLVVAAVALTGSEFLADGGNTGWAQTVLRAAGLDELARRLRDATTVSGHAEFNRLVFWAAVTVTAYVVPAVLCIRLVFRERVRDYGLRVRGVLAHVRAYALLYALAAPLIVAFSYTAAFQAKYPFLQPVAGQSLWPHLYLWWALYWLQFAALEFFFRGFIVHGLAPRLGWASIFAMVLPYNMLHYGKPMPEALAAIAGGVVLGTLSLKTRSVWPGAALHVAIALTMDVSALVHAGRVL
jgi:membrane protease YdiL (CAAX protease family)